MTDIVRVQCLPELNLLSVEEGRINGDTALYVLNTNTKDMKEKYGIIPLTYYTSYASQLAEDTPDRSFLKDLKASPYALLMIDPNTHSMSTNTTTFTCNLSDDENPHAPRDVPYTVTLEGTKWGECPECSCGTTFFLSIGTPDHLIFDKVPFIDVCNHKEIQDRGLGTLRLNASEGYIGISSSNAGIKSILWLPNAHYKDSYTGPYKYNDVYLKNADDYVTEQYKAMDSSDDGHP